MRLRFNPVLKMLKSISMDRLKFNLLARSIKGELKTDPVYREAFASAACLYRILPQAVAIPQDCEDLASILEFAAQEKIPVTARGAGSSVAGQALGSGIVISLSKYLNRILEIRPEEKKALVEPGVISADLNAALKPYGLFFPPDPSSGNYCTIGGMIANNSSGAHSLFYGATQNYLEEMEVILADGSAALVGKNKFELTEEKSYWARQIPRKLNRLFQEHKAAIEKDRPAVKNASGYLLWGALEPEGINYARLLAGSEGTLAVILKAWLKLENLPGAKSAGLIYFKDLSLAANAVLKLRRLNPQAVEIMDRNFINIVQDHYPELKPLLDDQAEYMLLLEFDGKSPEEAQEKIRAANDLILEKERLGYKSTIAENEREKDLLWQVRQAASPILYTMGSGLVRFIEDIVIPPEKLGSGLQRIRALFSEFKTFAPVMGHAGEGNLHLNPSFNPANKDDRRGMQIFADQVYKMVIELGGSISGEHGDGILRAPYVQAQFPNAYLAFKDLKKIFDPQNILNPGKILAEPGLIPVENIKYWTPETAAGRVQAELQKEKALDLIFRCHGCGLCRSYCPAIAGFETELALPRSKMSFARALSQGLLEDSALLSWEAQVLLDSCFSCQRCLNLCPTGVQVARVLEQLKNFQRQTRTFSPRQEILDRSGEMINRLARMPEPGIRLASSPLPRLALRSLGINPDASSFIKPEDVQKILQARNSPVKSDERKDAALKIIYFPGCLERWTEPQRFERTTKLLDEIHAEYTILSGLCCGLPSSQCNRELFLKSAQKFAAAVLPLIEKGYLLVSNCPGCISAFRRNYPLLLGEDGEKIDKAALSIFDLKEKVFGPLKEKPGGKNYVYHRACHIIGLGEPDPILEFIKASAGPKPAAVIEQCCGSAGTFELKMENVEASKKISSRLKKELEKAGASLVVSACGVCRRKIRALGFEAQSPLEIMFEPNRD